MDCIAPTGELCTDRNGLEVVVFDDHSPVRRTVVVVEDGFEVVPETLLFVHIKRLKHPDQWAEVRAEHLPGVVDRPLIRHGRLQVALDRAGARSEQLVKSGVGFPP